MLESRENHAPLRRAGGGRRPWPSAITPAASHCRSSSSTRRSETRRSTRTMQFRLIDAPSSRGCPRPARGSRLASPGRAAFPVPASRSASAETHMRGPKIRLEDRAPAPASSPSAPLGPGPSGCRGAADGHRPSECSAAVPAAGDTCRRAGRRCSSSSSAPRQPARSRPASRDRSPPSRGSVSLAATPPGGRHASRSGPSARGSVVPGSLGCDPESALQLAHVDPWACAHGGVGSGLAVMPWGVLASLTRSTQGPSLPLRYSSQLSTGVRPPRTPAAPRAVSPSAYPNRAAPTWARRRASRVPPFSLHTCSPPPRRDPTRIRLGRVRGRHGLHRDTPARLAWTVNLTRLQVSR